ncbi:hypothetical protein LCGC14_2385040 [marine sediment metagenome]|uniref:Uncharacterized protein n=1 Tax=marine sediment metagenome TaxID=412755 RepID=A0A0F9EUG4_9ZZZZ
MANGIKYIAKKDTWFDEGTGAELITDLRPAIDSGIFCGIKDGGIDEELCEFEEFTPLEF